MKRDIVDVTITIPFPVDRPDANGVIYSKEAVEEAIDRFNHTIPLVNRCGVPYKDRVVGFVNADSHSSVYDKDNNIYKLVFNGHLFNCYPEIIINNVDGNKITGFSIQYISVGR